MIFITKTSFLIIQQNMNYLLKPHEINKENPFVNYDYSLLYKIIQKNR